MPSVYTPTGVYHSTLTLPAPADAATAASVNTTGMQYLADNAQYCVGPVNKLIGGGTFIPSGPIAFASTVYADALVTAGAASIGGLMHSAGALFSGDVDQDLGVAKLAYSASTAADADTTINRNAITICTPSGTGNYAWTIFGTGQKNGDWAAVECNSTGICTLKDPSGNTLLTLDGGGSRPVCAAVVRVSGTWRPFLRGKG